MATVSNYTFDNMSRIGDDSCSLSQRNIQNTQSSNYALKSFFAQDCGMARPIEFATNQPNVFYNGSHQVGLGGCNIDANSDLLIGTINTHPKCRISLYQRPFVTVPYLGRGPPRPVIEARLQQGAMIQDLKSCKTIMDKSFEQYTSTPLIPSVKATIQNPANLVEGVAARGWIRGGLPSRELTRDQEYLGRRS